MADVKWIKFYVSILTNKKIKRIRKMPDGDTIALIWAFLLAQAGESNKDGAVYFNDEIPYSAEEFADDYDFKTKTVQLAILTFERFGMIGVFDGIIYVKNWEKYQSVDGLEKMRDQTKKRVAEFRERKRKQLGVSICQYCGEPSTGIDHIIATSRGGTEDDANKIPCCIECNRIKNDKPLIDFLNSNRERIDDDLITNNDKLIKHVTLCNVTNRYNVTHGNAIEQDKEIELDIDKDKTYMCAFEELWSTYPRKKEKAKAYKCYQTRIKDGYSENDLLAATKNYSDECKKNKTEEKYIKLGATFLGPNTPFIDYVKEEQHGQSGRNAKQDNKYDAGKAMLEQCGDIELADLPFVQ